MDSVDAIEQAWLRERPGTPVGSIGVLTRVRRIAKLLEDDRRRTLARLGVDASTLDLLSTLRRAGPPYRLTPTEIARTTLVTPGAVSQRIAQARSRGLVTREPAGPDGRTAAIALTPAGHALIDRTVDELLRHEDALLTALSPGQRTHLTALLRTLLADLTDRTGATSGRQDDAESHDPGRARRG